MQNQINTICTQFESTARLIGMQLNPKTSTAADIEEILSRVAAAQTDKPLDGVIFMSGIYLGEMLRLRLGGEWIMPPPTEQLALQLKSQRYSPFEITARFLYKPTPETLVQWFETVIAQHAS